MTNPFSALAWLFLKRSFKKESIPPFLVGQIEKELNDINLDNHKKAIETYPSKHLKDDESAWFNMLDKQNKYTKLLDSDSEKIIAEKYNLTIKQIDAIKNNLFIKNAKKLRETKEWKDWNNNLKK